MRITEGTIAGNYLYNLGQTRERIVKLQTQLASGKQVLKASDNPQSADTILRLTESMNQREQYVKNAIDAQGAADTTSATLGQFSDILLSVKDLVVRASSTAFTADKATFAEQADQLLSEMMDIAQHEVQRKIHLRRYGDHDTAVQMAADKSAVTANPNGIDGIISVQLGENVSSQVNISGESGLNGTQYFEMVIQIRDSLKNGTFNASDFVGQVESAADHVLNQASLSASYAEHFRSVSDNLEEQQLQLKQYLSMVQDTDVAEATMKLKHEEVMLDAALNTGGRVIPKTLIDFLR
jgi:flagellar hook-associated protein 3 FlgL